MAKKIEKIDKDLKIGKVALHLTNQQKLYWQKEGITKGELVEYYEKIAPVMLPYLKDRPESMRRHPNGINGPDFFQKNIDIRRRKNRNLFANFFFKTSGKRAIHLNNGFRRLIGKDPKSDDIWG